MENKAKYLWVGVFVFGVFFASLFVLIWLNDFSSKEEFKYYQIYTSESVAGLSQKSSVRLLGVEIGSVEELSLHKKDKETLVRILVKINEEAPIYTTTVASLELQGITGLKYVDLSNEEGERQELISKNGEIPTIKSKSSLFSSINKQGDKIVNLLDFADERARLLLSMQNVQNFSALLKNLSDASYNINKLAQRMTQMTYSIEKAATTIQILGQSGASTLQSYDKLSSSLAENLSILQRLLVVSTELIKTLEQSPSDLFFKGTKPNLAPGE